MSGDARGDLRAASEARDGAGDAESAMTEGDTWSVACVRKRGALRAGHRIRQDAEAGRIALDAVEQQRRALRHPGRNLRDGANLMMRIGTGGLPIRYLWPLTEREWSYDGHWVLASWPNAAVMTATALGVVVIEWRRRSLREPPR